MVCLAFLTRFRNTPMDITTLCGRASYPCPLCKRVAIVPCMQAIALVLLPLAYISAFVPV